MDALIYTLGAFVLILVLARLRVPLALSIFCGAVLVGITFGLGPMELVRVLAAGTVKLTTLALVVVTVLIIVLSQVMRQGGQMEQIVALARSCLRRPAFAMAALPAIIGLLPMPGGALFSAPMVDSARGKLEVDRGKLSAVNYWFRHIWEHWWPLYPGVMLAVTLRGSDLSAFVAQQVALGVLMALAGIVIFRGMHPDLHVTAPPAPEGTKRKLLWAMSPIWVILIAWGLAAGGFSVVSGEEVAGGSDQASDVLVGKYAPVIFALFVGLVWTLGINRTSPRQVVKILSRWSIYQTVALIVSVMIFQHILAHVDAAAKIGIELTNHHVPVMLVVVILPFIAGMVTGIAIGFVGTSFPIVLELLTSASGDASVAPAAVLAYASGHLGMMLSPLHLCHVLSNRYFKTNFGPVYRSLALPAIIMAVFVTGYYLLLRAIFG